MSDRDIRSIRDALGENPFHRGHYDALADAVLAEHSSADEALDVITRVLCALPESSELVQTVPHVEHLFSRVIPALEAQPRRLIYEGLARFSREILADPDRALRYLTNAYKEAPDPALAADVGMAGLEIRDDGWARPYLEAHVKGSEAPHEIVLQRLGEIALQNDDLGSAEHYLTQLGDINPDHPRVIEYLDAIESRKGDIESEAKSLRDQIKSATGDDVPLMLQELARYLYMLNRTSDEATDALLRVVRESELSDDEMLTKLASALESQGRFEDLIDVLRARLETEERPSRRIRLHLRLSDLLAAEKDDVEGAIRQLQRATELDPRQPEVLPRLEALYRKQNDLPALAEYLERAIKGRPDKDHEIALRQRLGLVYWKETDDQRGAERIYKRLRSLAPDLIEPLDFYQDLYIQQKKYDNLFSIFSYKAEILSGDALVEAAREIERITSAESTSPEKQLEIWKKVIRKEPTHAAASERYRELLVRMGRWHSVIDFLKTRLKEMSEDQRDAKIDVLFQIVEIFGDPEKLDMEDMCTNAYREVLELDAHNERALDALIERYRATERYKELARILLSKADLIPDGDEKSAILTEVIDITTRRVRDSETSLTALERLHALDPTNSDVVDKLKSYYRQRKDYDAWFRLLEEQLDADLPTEERKKTLVELARMAQEKLRDAERAIDLLEQAAALDPNDEAIRFRLETIYRKDERWADYARLLETRLDRMDDEGQRVALLDKLGKLYTDKVGDYEAAERVYLEIRRLRPGKLMNRSHLERIYLTTRNWEKLRALFEEDGDWSAYVNTLGNYLKEREASQEVLPIQFEIAEVMRERLKNPEGERRALEHVLEINAEYTPALERLLDIYTNSGDTRRQITMLTTLVSQSEDVDQQVARMAQLVDLYDLDGDEAAARALLLDKLEVLLGSKATALLERVRDMLRDEDAVEACRARLVEILQSDLGDDTRMATLAELGDLYADQLSDPDGAIAFFSQMLDIDPGSDLAIDRLARLYEQEGRTTELVEILTHSLERKEDHEERADLLVRLAMIAEEIEGDQALAVQHYLQALDETPGAEHLFDSLERIYSEREDWGEVADLYLRRIDTAREASERDSLKLSLAQVYATQLDRVDDALDLLISLSSGSELSGEAVRAIEELFQAEIEQERSYAFLDEHFTATESWDQLIELLDLRYASTEEKDLLTRQVQIFEERYQDPSRAFDALSRVLLADPNEPNDWKHLEALAEQTERYVDLFSQLSRAVGFTAEEGEAVLDDERLSAELLLKTGDLARDQLSDPETAVVVYERLRAIDPEDLGVIDRLLELRQVLADRDELVELLKIKLDRVHEDAEKRTLLRRIADNIKEDDAVEEQAIDYLQQLLVYDGEDGGVVTELDELYEKYERHDELVLLIREHKLPLIQDGVERINTLLRIAGLQWLQQDDPHGAVETAMEALAVDDAFERTYDLIEELLDEDDVDLRVRIVETLEPIYQRLDHHARLIRVLTVKADDLSDPFEQAVVEDQIAVLLEDAISEPDLGLDMRLRAVAHNPSEGRLQGAHAKATELGQWNKLAAVLREILAEPGMLNMDGALMLADLFMDRLNDMTEAVVWYERVREEDPSNLHALERLRTIYGQQGERDRELAVLNDLVDHEAEPARRRELFLQAAEIEWSRDRLAEAEPYYLQALDLMDQRTDEPATRCYDRLRELYRRQDQLASLIDVLRDRQVHLSVPEDQKTNLYEIAELLRETGNPDDAVLTYREILSSDPNDPVAINTIEGVFVEQEQWSDYEAFLRELLDRAEGAGEVAVLRKLGTYYLFYASAPLEASKTFEQILTREPDDSETLESALGLLEEADVRGDVFLFLERFAEEHERNDLLDLIYREAIERFSDDEYDRRQTLSQLARLNQEVFERPAEAVDFAAEALLLEPGDEAVWSRRVDVCRTLGSFENAIQALDKLIEGADDPIDQLHPLSRKAFLLLDEMGDPESADETFEELLAIDPDDHQALEGQVRILRDGAEPERLVKRLQALINHEDEAAARIELHKEIGALLLEELDRPEEAAAAYLAALDEGPDDEALYDLVAALYRRVEALDDAYDILQRKLMQFGDEGERTHEIQHQLLELLIGWDARHDDAKDLAIALVERHGVDDQAVTYLESEVARGVNVELLMSVLDRALSQGEQWARMAALYQSALTHLSDAGARATYLSTARDLYADRLEEPLPALKAQLELIRLDSADTGRHDLAEELAGRAEAYDELVLFYQELMEEVSDQPYATDLIARIARLYEDRLEDSSTAVQFFRLVIERDPGSQEAFERLVAIYEKQEDWTDLTLLHEGMAESLVLVEEKVHHLQRAYRIASDRLNDRQMSRSLLRQVVELVPSDIEAAETLEQMYLEDHDVRSLQWLYPYTIEHCEDAPRRARLRCNHGRLLIESVEDYLEGIGQIEEALLDAPGMAAARELLERVLDLDYLPISHRASIIARTVDLLEGLYDESTEPERRILMLEKKLVITEEAGDQMPILSQLADLYEHGVEDFMKAFDALNRAVRLFPSDDRLHGRLVETAERYELNANLVSIYEDVLDENDEDEILDAYLLRLGDLLRKRLSRPLDAARHLSIYNKRRPGDRSVLAFLEQAYRDAKEADKLLDILEERTRYCDDSDERGMLLLEAATLLEEQVQDSKRLVTVYQQYLEVDSQDYDVAEKLEALLLKQQDFHALVRYYEERLAQTTEPARRVSYLKRDAQLRETSLEQYDEAISLLEEILTIEPANMYALNSLERLYGRMEDHESLHRVLSRRLEIVDTPGERVALRFRLGELQLTHLHTPEDAIEHFAVVLGITPDHAETIRCLEGLLDNSDARARAFELLEHTYEDSRNDEALSLLYVELYKKIDDPAFKAALAVKAGDIFRARFGDPSTALKQYGNALKHEPGHREHRERLDELIRATGLWEPAAQLIPDIVAAIQDEEHRAAAAADFGELFSSEHDGRATAIRLFEIARATAPEDHTALVRLAELYQDVGDHAQVVQTWEQLADSPDMETAQRYRFRLGAAYVEEQATQERGVEILSELFFDGYKRRRVAAILLSMVERAEASGSVLDLLEQFYRDENDVAALVGILQVRLASLEDASEQAERCREIGMLYRDRLDEYAMAYDFLSRAVLLDRRLVDLLPALEELAGVADQVQALADLLEGWVDDEEDEVQQEDLLRVLLRLYTGPLNSVTDAERTLTRLLAHAPSDVALLDKLLDLLENSGNLESWIRFAWTRVDLAAGVDERNEILTRLAEKAGVRRDADTEIKALEKLLENDALHVSGQRRLEDLYESTDQSERVVLLLEKRVDRLEDPVVFVETAIQLAGLKLMSAPDDDSTVGLLERALEYDPHNDVLLTLLANALRGLERYTELIDVLQRTADRQDDPAAKKAAYAEMAEVTAELLDDPAGAARRYEEIRALDQTDADTIERLLVLYEKLQMPEQLLSVLNHKLRLEQDPNVQVSILVHTAHIHLEELSRPDMARAVLDNVLAQDPYSKEALLLSARVADAEGDRFAARRGLERLLSLDLEEFDRVRCLKSLLDILLDDRDFKGAKDHLLALLALVPDDDEALDQLVKVYEALGLWDALIEVYERKVKSAASPQARAGWLRKVAYLHRDHLDQIDAFESWMDRAIEAKRDDEETVRALIDHYRARDEREKQRPHLEWYVAYLETRKKKALFAKYASELATVYQAAGEVERAIEFRKQIKKQVPQNYENQIDLGGLYLEIGKHDEAQRTLNSVLLKQHQLDSSEKKVEMYLHLAKTVQAQANPKKALQYAQRVLAMVPDHAEALSLKKDLS
jgi:golgin subfamily B member 1